MPPHCSQAGPSSRPDIRAGRTGGVSVSAAVGACAAPPLAGLALPFSALAAPLAWGWSASPSPLDAGPSFTNSDCCASLRDRGRERVHQALDRRALFADVGQEDLADRAVLVHAGGDVALVAAD